MPSKSRNWRGVFWPEYIQPLQLWCIGWSRRAYSITEGLLEFSFIEISYFAYREDSHVEVVLSNDVRNQIGCDGETIEDQGLDILKDVSSFESIEYATQRTPVKAGNCSV